MTATIVTILIIAGSAYLIYRLRKRFVLKGIYHDLDSLGIPKHEAEFKKTILTPEGAVVYSPVDVPVEALKRIDKGIAAMIESHLKRWPDWKNYNSVKDYSVVIVEPRTYNVETDPGSPAVLIKGIQSAGSNIGAWPMCAAKKPYLVIPHQEDCEQGPWSHLDYLEATAFNEGEHCHEWMNDKGVWGYFTTADDVHPHDYSIFQ